MRLEDAVMIVPKSVSKMLYKLQAYICISSFIKEVRTLFSATSKSSIRLYSTSND